MKVLTLLLLYGVFEILPFKSLLQSTLVLDLLFFSRILIGNDPGVFASDKVVFACEASIFEVPCA